MSGYIRLRPHHILCIAHFSGHGYDDRFTVCMTRVSTCLNKNPSTPILLVEGPDDLCAACPNRTENGCRSGAKPLRYDRTVARLCHLWPGEIFPWHLLAQKAQGKILYRNLLSSVCSDCCWHTLCRAEAARRSGKQPANRPG